MNCAWCSPSNDGTDGICDACMLKFFRVDPAIIHADIEVSKRIWSNRDSKKRLEDNKRRKKRRNTSENSGAAASQCFDMMMRASMVRFSPNMLLFR